MTITHFLMDSRGLPTLLISTVLVLVWLASTIWARRPPRAPLPPGPPGEFLIGHLRVVPEYSPERTYMRWAREYASDVLHLRVLGQSIVVLNSPRAAIDLLDRRGANYSDRPRFVLFEEMGWVKTLTFQRWGPQFRLHRRILQKGFQKSNIVQYRPLQEREAHELLRGLLRQPEGWETRLRRFATAVVMSIGFGVDIKSDDDEYIKIAEDTAYALGHGGAPAGTLVDFFPFLRKLPTWLVWNKALRHARDWRGAIRRLHDVPYAAVLRQADPAPSLVRSLLEQQKAQAERGEPVELTEDDIKGAAGAVYAAGQDTTWAVLVVWVLNMVLHPAVQAKAQAMVDAVVGHDRLPTFADRKHLPYLEHMLQEVMRWCPVSPVGVPHRTLEDDVYNGMLIPRHSLVYANAWAMTHDERTYQDPDTFDPDRYLPVGEGGRGEPWPIGQFGFGRRICVGNHLAEANMWIVMASLLATFTIEKAVGPDGKEITPQVEFTQGLTSHPSQFPCLFRPRSERAIQLIYES